MKEEKTMDTTKRNQEEMCYCGHFGGAGLLNQHANRFSVGHGPCHVYGCGCRQFTWMRFASQNEVSDETVERRRLAQQFE